MYHASDLKVVQKKHRTNVVISIFAVFLIWEKKVIANQVVSRSRHVD